MFQLGLAAENAALHEDKGRLVCVLLLVLMLMLMWDVVTMMMFDDAGSGCVSERGYAECRKV